MADLIKALEAARAANKEKLPGEPAVMLRPSDIHLADIPNAGQFCFVRYEALIRALKDQAAA